MARPKRQSGVFKAEAYLREEAVHCGLATEGISTGVLVYRLLYYHSHGKRVEDKVWLR